jgi:hypothetical protein
MPEHLPTSKCWDTTAWPTTWLCLLLLLLQLLLYRRQHANHAQQQVQTCVVCPSLCLETHLAARLLQGLGHERSSQVTAAWCRWPQTNEKGSGKVCISISAYLLNELCWQVFRHSVSQLLLCMVAGEEEQPGTMHSVRRTIQANMLIMGEYRRHVVNCVCEHGQGACGMCQLMAVGYCQ